MVDTCKFEDGNIYKLLSCKVKKAAGRYNKGCDIAYLYIKTEENGKAVLNLKGKLEELCQFGSLSRQKVISRLGHFQSEVKFVLDIKSSDIEKINEWGNVGCGFVPPG